MTIEPPEDPHRILLRERLASLLGRAERASSWRGRLTPLRALVNRDGHVPVRARLAVADLEFLSSAREELLALSTLLLRLLDLHQPRDAGGITSDSTHPVLRCRSCMWRWPCPTFRTLAEALPYPAAAHPAPSPPPPRQGGLDTERTERTKGRNLHPAAPAPS